MVEWVRVGEVKLEVVAAGSGPPVVFSHGGASDVRYWEPQRAAFVGAGYRFVAYSQRFRGRSRSAPNADASAAAHARDLLGLLQSVGDGPVHVVGFSSAVAVRAAALDPSPFRTLTIVEPNVPWVLEGDPAGEEVLAWWRAENERVRAVAGGDAERGAALWFELVEGRGPDRFAAQPAWFRGMWLEMFDRRGAAAPPPPESLTCEHLAGIAVPVLALGGEASNRYSRAILPAVAACLPDVRLVTLPGATHFVSFQDPSAFNAAVLSFLADR